MKKLVIFGILNLLLYPALVLPQETKPAPTKKSIVTKAKQRQILDATLKDFHSEAKVKTLLAFLVSPHAEIKNGALKALRELPACYQINPLLEVLPANIPVIREYASTTLGTLGKEESITPLFQAVLKDPYEKIRKNALNSLLKLTSQARLIKLLNQALKQEGCGPYHIRAAGCLGEIGYNSDIAINALVERLKIIRIWPPGPRAHIIFQEQFTYIKDYDIVQSAGPAGISSADPVADTVYSGIVFDVKVIRVEEYIEIERDVVSQSLDNITGLAYGQDMNQWVQWWGKEQQKGLIKRYKGKKLAIKQGSGTTPAHTDTEKHLALGIWCRIQKLQQEAVGEFTTILKQDPKYKGALAQLKEMGYVFYHDQWRPLGEVFPHQERLIIRLLDYLKFYDPKKSKEARAELEAIEPFYKLRPFIKYLQVEPWDKIRDYIVKELATTEEPKVIPYLVKTSLLDDSETVRNNAFDSIAKIDPQASIPWYIYFLDNNPGAPATLRATRILGEIGSLDSRVITALLRRMYRINLGNQAAQNIPAPALPKMFTLDTDKKENLLLGTVKIEMPDIELADIKTEEQLNSVASSLAKVTGKNFGKDYTSWNTWWQEYNSKQ